MVDAIAERQEIERTTANRYPPHRWPTNPMGMVDSYGYFWALNDVLETVCGGKWVDVQAGKRSHRKRHRTPSEPFIWRSVGIKGERWVLMGVTTRKQQKADRK